MPRVKDNTEYKVKKSDCQHNSVSFVDDSKTKGWYVYKCNDCDWVFSASKLLSITPKESNNEMP